jgi:hypothetical protein
MSAAPVRQATDESGAHLRITCGDTCVEKDSGQERGTIVVCREGAGSAHRGADCGKLIELASSKIIRGIWAFAAAVTLAVAGICTGLLVAHARVAHAAPPVATQLRLPATLPEAHVAARSNAPSSSVTLADVKAATPPVNCPQLTPVDPPWLAAAPPPPPSQEAPIAPKSLERRIAFWLKVWGERGDNQHYLVDERRPWIVHAEVDCRDLYKSDGDDSAKAAAKDACGGRLTQARRAAQQKLKKEWSSPKMLKAFDYDRKLAKSAADNIIAIQGRKDALARAFSRAESGLGTAEGTFQNLDVPRVYARAAIVESLWRPEALSRSGAGGVYQFMSKTGRQFLTVDDGVVDERLDPLRAAWAAATYMSKMAKDFNNDWPLVLTAYNTGPSRLKKVMKARGSKDIGKIADAGDWNEFGFDGENYYAQIAAIGRITVEDRFEPKPFTGHAVRVESPLSFSDLAACVDAPKAVLAEANPSLAEPVVDGKVNVPAGYVAHVPTIPVTTASR